MKKIVIFFIALLFLSCTSKVSVDKAYYVSGNLQKVMYSTQKGIDSTVFYYDSVKRIVFKKVIRKINYDSIKVYYKNGNLFKEGKRSLDSLKFGNWIYYTKESLKSDIREYYTIGNKSFLNRIFYLNRKGDTVWYGNKFNTYNQTEFKKEMNSSLNSSMVVFDFYQGDTISLDKPFAAAVRCNSPLMRKYNSQIVMFLAKEKANFNSRFSNSTQVRLDTFKNVLLDVHNVNNFNAAKDKQYIAVFGRWFKTSGEKILRGYMLEYANFLDEHTNDSVRGERKVYFEKKIYVKDTLVKF